MSGHKAAFLCLRIGRDLETGAGLPGRAAHQDHSGLLDPKVTAYGMRSIGSDRGFQRGRTTLGLPLHSPQIGSQVFAQALFDQADGHAHTALHR